MQRLRVTRYDPARRDAEGRFLDDTWTSVSDIGKRFGGQVLTAEEYLRVEAAYVETILGLLSAAGVPELVVSGVEQHDLPVGWTLPDDEELRRELDRVADGVVVSGAVLARVIRLALREHLWCKLSAANGAYVHFGYDYYTYVGVPGTGVAAARQGAIFVEPDFPSPHP